MARFNYSDATFYSPSELHEIQIADAQFAGNYASDTAIPDTISTVSVISGENLSKRISSTSVLGIDQIFVSGVTVTNPENKDAAGVNGSVLANTNYTFIAGSTFANNKITGKDSSGNYARGGVIFTQQWLETAKGQNGQSTVFYNNIANGRGGAIYASAGVNISGTTFSNNKSLQSYAGALYIDGTNASQIKDTLFSGNEANTEAGALYIRMKAANTKVSVIGSTFADNIAKINGGAIYGKQGEITINGSTFASKSDTIYCEATATLKFTGYNVFNANVTSANVITVENSTLRFANTSPVSISNMSFSGNSNSIIFSGSEKVTFTTQNLTDVSVAVTLIPVSSGSIVVASGIDSGLAMTISLNGDDAAVNGAGFLCKVDNNWIQRVIYAGTDLTVQSSDTIKIGYAANNGFDSFAAYDDFLAANYGNFTGTIQENGAVSAEIYTPENNNRIVINGTVYRGTYAGASLPETISAASAVCGIISSARSVVSAASVFDRTIFENSIVSKLNGGALNVTASSYLYGSTFSGNKNSDIAENSQNYVRGGAIWSNANLVIKAYGKQKSVFSNNQSQGLGGAIYQAGSTLTVENSDFIANKTLAQHGGAIYNYSGTTAIINKSCFENNTAEMNGGAIFAAGTVTITDTVFFGNQANLKNGSYYGGAIYVNGGITNISGSKFLTETDTIYNKGALNISGSNTINADVAGTGTFNVTDAVLTFGNAEAISVATLTFSGAESNIVLDGAVVNFTEQGLSGVNITINTDSFDFTNTEAITVATGISDYNSAKVSFTQNAEFFKTALSTDGTLTYKLKNTTVSAPDGSVTGNQAVNIVDKTISIGNIFFAADQVMDNVSTLISGGRIGQGVVGGVYSKNRAENEITSASLTVTGGTIAGDVFAGGYLYGTNDKNSAVPYTMNVGTVNMTLAGGIVSGKIQCGISAHKYGVANVETVNLTVSGGDFNTVFGGGWAQTAGQSSVGTVNITVSGGTISELYAGGNNGKQYVGESAAQSLTGSANITVSGGTITDLYLSGKYEPSRVTGSVTLTLNGNAEITNIYGYREDPTTNTDSKPEGATEVVVLQDAAVGKVQNVDTLTIAENATLTGEFSGIGNVVFDIGNDGEVSTGWEALSGSNLSKIFAQTQITFNGVTYDSLAAFADTDFADIITKDDGKELLTIAKLAK